MNSEQQLRAAWFEAHDEVRAYLQPFASIELGRKLASQACGYWVRKAADGAVPSSCAYASLFEAAAYLLVHHPAMPCTVSEQKLHDNIPYASTLLPYQMSKLYVDVWKAGQLLGWERKLINRASKYVSEVWPSSATCHTAFDLQGLGPLAEPLARRAVAVLSEHQCLECEICDQASQRWEDEDKRTEEWFTAQRLSRLEKQ